jgi:hypothetical protein
LYDGGTFVENVEERVKSFTDLTENEERPGEVLGREILTILLLER